MAVRYGRYEVLYKLGQGAMAQVFLAKDPVLSRFVAIKVLHADLATRKDVLHRFFNEARTVAAIRSPHVVEVFDFGQEGRDLYLVMEFVDGMSLHALLRHVAPQMPGTPPAARPAPGEGRALPEEPGILLYEPLRPALAAALICQAADGLSIAAAQGVVHRDLKPENLMLNTRGYLKISDFGIAHVQDESLTKTGAVLGSPLYMSPEQARGLKPITAQSDMFSLGAVFYAALAGHPPFRGRTVTELFRRISAEPHPPLARLRPDLDPDLCLLVDTLLRKRPEERGGGAIWLHRQLKSFLMSQGALDPAEMAAAYLRELGERGVQTTWKPDGRNATLPITLAATQPATGRFLASPPPPLDRAATAYPAGTMPAGSLPVRARSRPEKQARERNRSAPLILALMVLGLSAGLSAWGWAALKAALATGMASVEMGSPARDGKTISGGIGPGEESGPGEGRGEGGSADLASKEPDWRIENASGNDAGDPAAGDGNGSDTMAGETSSAQGAIPLAGNKAPEAILILKSSPPFSEAYLDGHFVGTTPVRIAPLAPGRHRLAMKSARLAGLDTSILVEPGIHALKVHLEDGAALRVAATSVDGD
jgi:eukaryotic-like serine/threonine-protein kinase